MIFDQAISAGTSLSKSQISTPLDSTNAKHMNELIK